MFQNKKLWALFIICFIVIWLGPSGFRFAHKVYAAASNEKEQFIFNGPVAATAKGKTIIGMSLQYQQKVGQYVLFLGKVVVSGKIVPATPGADLPTKIQILGQHKNAKNKVVQTFSFIANVQSSGAILVQSFPFTTFDLINRKEFLNWTVIPVDKNLPACKLTLKATHFIGVSARLMDDDETNTEAVAGTPPILTMNISEYEAGFSKSEIKGPFQFKALDVNGYPFHGTIRVKGKITRDEPSEHLPGALALSFKRIDPITKNTIATDDMNVVVQSDGRVLNQSFPFDTNLVGGKPELIQASFHATGQNMPSGVVQIKLTFVQSVP